MYFGELFEEEQVVGKTHLDLLFYSADLTECENHESFHEDSKQIELLLSLLAYTLMSIPTTLLHVLADHCADRAEVAQFVHILNDLSHRQISCSALTIVTEVFEA